jgi:hypothetical protein
MKCYEYGPGLTLTLAKCESDLELHKHISLLHSGVKYHGVML